LFAADTVDVVEGRSSCLSSPSVSSEAMPKIMSKKDIPLLRRDDDEEEEDDEFTRLPASSSYSASGMFV
jgi:hypothetical protein